MKQNHMFKKTMALMMALLLLGLAGCTGPKRTGETIDIITDEGRILGPDEFKFCAEDRARKRQGVSCII